MFQLAEVLDNFIGCGLSSDGYISTFQTKIRNICLSEFWNSIGCLWSPSYTSCRGLKYLLKVVYILLVYFNMAGFSISNTVFYYRMETLPYV